MSLLLRRIVVGQKPGRQGHDQSNTDAKKRTQGEEHIDVIGKKATGTGEDIKHQSSQRNLARTEVATDIEEEKVGNDNK